MLLNCGKPASSAFPDITLSRITGTTNRKMYEQKHFTGSSKPPLEHFCHLSTRFPKSATPDSRVDDKHKIMQRFDATFNSSLGKTYLPCFLSYIIEEVISAFVESLNPGLFPD